MTTIMLLIAAFLPSNPDHYRYQTTLVLAMGASFLTVFLWERLRFLPAIAFLTVVFLGVSTVYWRVTPYDGLGNISYLLMCQAVLEALGFFLLTTLPVAVLTRQKVSALVTSFAWLGLLNSIWILVDWAIGDAFINGAFDASSVDASMLAVLYPLMVFRPGLQRYDGTNWFSIWTNWKYVFFDLACVVLPPLAILVTRSSTGYAALVVVFFAYAYARGVRVSLLGLVAAMSAPLVLSFGYLLMRQQLFDSSGRLEMLRQSFDFWRANAPVWTGFGLGSFSGAGPYLVKIPERVIWMHNDWAQILFELGAIGLGVALLLYLALLIRSKAVPWLFASAAGYGFIALFQMPLHQPLGAVFGALLVVRAFQR